MSVVNFKGIRKVQLAFTPLTVLVGENATGKSTVLQALSILKRSVGQSGINTDLTYANLGPLNQLVPPAATATIAFRGWSQMRDEARPFQKISFGCLVSFDAQGLSEYKTTLDTNGFVCHNEWTRYGVNRIEPQKWTLPLATMNFTPTNVIGIAFGLGGYSTRGQLSADDQKQAVELYGYFGEYSKTIKQVLDNFFVVGPMRGLTEPLYSLQSNATQEYVPRGGVAQLGDSLATNLEYNRDNTRTISDWQAEIVGAHVKTELVPGARVLVRNPDTGADFVNEGFGSNQLLFVLERIANSPPDSVIGVEEPEIHLHPKAQFNFGKWVSRAMPTLRKQLIILTHSPDIVSGILSGVRHNHIAPQEVSVWFFEKKKREITATKSEVNPEGKVVGPALKSFLESTAAQLSEP